MQAINHVATALMLGGHLFDLAAGQIGKRRYVVEVENDWAVVAHVLPSQHKSPIAAKFAHHEFRERQIWRPWGRN